HMLMTHIESGEPLEDVRKKLKSHHTPGVLSQFERMLRQQQRLEDTSTLLNTGQGRDQSGMATTISQHTYMLESYYDVLSSLFDKLKISEWAIQHLDDCLFIGLNRGAFRPPAIFGHWLRGCQFDGPVTNYVACMTQPLARPPMLAPVIQEHVESL